MNLKGSQTEKNLKKTFSGESKATVKYKLYAEKAREEGYKYIGDVFEETASNELAHAREVYGEYLDQIKSTEDNLMNSFMGESSEATRIYKDYELIARNEGFDRIADLYKDLAEVEAEHDIRFRKLYNGLLTNTLYTSTKNSLWKCTNCGYIYEGESAPIQCPLCHFPQGWFMPYCSTSK